MQLSDSAALAGNACPRKRLREDPPNNVLMHPTRRQDENLNPQQCFLPTHLSLLRALHADDETAHAKTVESCSHPSWVEVNSFVQFQASIVERRSQAARVAAVLRALGGQPSSSSTTTINSTTSAIAPPRYSAAAGGGLSLSAPAGQNRKDRQEDEAGAKRSVDLTRADQAGGVGASSAFSADGKAGSVGSCTRANLFSFEPRSVVCGVLRRAVRNQEADHASTWAGLHGLKRGVDDTISQLESSLERLGRSRRDRAKPWIAHWQGEGAHAADVVERHANKLVLWRRLQLALGVCRIAGDERGGREEPGRPMVRMRHSKRQDMNESVSLW